MTPERRIWKNMKRKRCGGLEIKVCDKWQSFEVFLSDVGNRPSPAHNFILKDKNGKVEPGKAKWATRKEPNRNRSNNKFVTLQGNTLCLSELAETKNLKAATINNRLRNGYKLEEACDERFQERRRRPKSRVLVGARDAVATLSGNFKATDVLDVMIERGFAFGAKTPISAVNRALRRLSKANEVRIAVKRASQKGNQYTRITKDVHA